MDTNFILDLSGNAIADTLIFFDWDKRKNDSSKVGRIIGRVISNDTNSIIHAFNAVTAERYVVISNNREFIFENLPPGFYYLQAYEKYEFSFSDNYTYYGGSWEPFSYSNFFSEFIGPVEVRANWDIDGIELKIE